MSRTSRPPRRRRSAGTFLSVYGGALVLLIAGFVLAYQFVEPAPPRRIVLATGGTTGAYHAFGQALAEDLEEQGITVEVRATSGTVENLGLLQDPLAAVDLAFVQGGVGDPVQQPDIMSLASLYFEPLWVFVRGDAPERLTGLRGRRLAVGAEGSGTRAVALRLLGDNGITPASTELEPLGGMAAAEALRRGDLDAVFTVASPTSAVVAALATLPGVELMSFTRADAYARTHRYLSVLTLPEGALNLAVNLPPRPVTLLAPAATLAARTDLHPALVGLILMAAERRFHAGGLFETPGQFPSDRYLDFPLSEDAQRFFSSGPPFLQRFLPFWAATLVDRMLVMLVPLLTLLVPLVRFLPPVYRWRVRARIYRWYEQLRAIEDGVRDHRDTADVAQALRALAAMEEEVRHVTVPLSYADEHYSLRRHIAFVRDRLEADTRA
ncbi:MAG: TAXI family TRAP transporter solute-binding subunit [Rhodobacterales bacterium]|nr:TAXI family TRAP transporter solute-binding subunit [Rhodobacterales bacterium]